MKNRKEFIYILLKNLQNLIHGYSLCIDKLNIKFKSLPDSKKIILVVLSLGILGCVLLMFSGVQNLVIVFAEKAILQRPLNFPDNAYALLKTASGLGLFYCFLIIYFVFWKKLLWEKLEAFTIHKKAIIFVSTIILLGSIPLSFNNVRNLIIIVFEKIVLHRMLNNPDNAHQILFDISLVGIISFCVIFPIIIFIKRISIWDRLSQIVIFLFLVIGLFYAINKAQFHGEADSYIIASISIQQHRSLDIREGDIRQLETEGYPAYLVDRTKNRFEGNTFYPKDSYGKQYPWYMGTYSISILPVRAVNYILNLPQTYSCQISNVLSYFLALLVVYLFFKQTRKNVFLTILLLACSPTFVYTAWASAEVFICSLMIISLVFIINGNRYLAALFMSIASTLNITICGFAIIIIVDYFISIYNDEKGSKEKGIWVNIIKRNWKRTIKLAICFFPALITPLWSLYHYHLIIPMLTEEAQKHIFNIFWVKRFFAYLFDLNLGFLPYFPILLILFFITLLAGIYKKNRQIITLTFGFFIVVFLYSAMPHINSGMTGIARYNSWSAPFLVFAVVSHVNFLFKNENMRRAIGLSLIISASTAFMITKNNSLNHIYFTPVARFFLDNAPALYNPYPFTFINRNEHYDGGYDVNADRPFIYYSEDGYARKILIPPQCNDPTVFFELNLSAANNSDMGWLIEQAKKIKGKRGNYWAYLNIPSGKKFTGIHIIGVKYFLNPYGLPAYTRVEMSVAATLIGRLSFELAPSDGSVQVYSELVSIKPDSYYFAVLDYNAVPNKLNLYDTISDSLNNVLKTLKGKHAVLDYGILQYKSGLLFVYLYDTISNHLNHVQRQLSLNSKHEELLLYSGDSNAFLGEQYIRVFSYYLKEPVKVFQLSLYELEADKMSNSVYIPFYDRWAKPDF